MIETTSQFSDNGVRMFDVRGLKPHQVANTKGNQAKWFVENCFVKGQFFYQEQYWKDNQCEVIASDICRQLDINAVEQKLCKIQTDEGVLDGSYSENFNGGNDEFVSFYRILKKYGVYRDVDINWKRMSTKERFDGVVSMINEYCNVDWTEYLSSMILIDCIIGNVDRHLNNFGLIKNISTGKFKIAPLFDFGLSLFEHDTMYSNVSLTTAINKTKMQPFSSSIDKQLSVVATKIEPTTIYLDYSLMPNLLAPHYIKSMLSKFNCRVERRD